MFYIYILYSELAKKYYIGYTNNLSRRIIEHNSGNSKKFTGKYSDWKIKVAFECGTSRSEAMKIEKFIKKQKSNSFLEKLIDSNFIPTGILAQLVRVPQMRD